MKKQHYSQDEVRSWFDATYRRIGFDYLRPKDAYRIFPELLGVRAGRKILDIGCGPGLLLSVSGEHGLKACGIDISREALEMCKIEAPGANVLLANAEAIPYEDRQFDYVTCIGSLERFMNLEQALSEQKRVTRDDARFCYMVRNSSTISWRVFMQFLGQQSHQSHQGAKSLAEWKEVFARSGFEILDIYPDHWPYLRFLRFVTFGSGRIDYGKLRRPILPLKFAYEFIFILKKKSDSREV